MKEDFRRLGPEHKEIVLKMVEQIWDGEDYTKIVYDDWVQNQRSPFYGLWIDDNLVGIGKLTRLTDHDIWLEGLKKNPECTIPGIGKRFVKFFFDMLKDESGLHSIRFSTYYANTESIRLNTQIGFEKTHTFSNLTYEIDVFKQPVEGVEIFNGSIEDLVGLFSESEFFHAMDGFITQGWVFYPSTEDILRKFIRNGIVLVTRSENGIEGAILLTDSPKERSVSLVSIAAEDEATRKKLLDGAVYLTQQRGVERITMMCPEHPAYLQWLKDFGFESWEQDHDVFLFTYPMETLKVFDSSRL